MKELLIQIIDEIKKMNPFNQRFFIDIFPNYENEVKLSFRKRNYESQRECMIFFIYHPKSR
jgi:hypothetical protein